MANQNVTQLTQQTVSAATSSLFYAVVGGATDTGLPLSVLFNNPAFTGVPTTPTAAVNTNTTQIASTAYVINQGYLTTASASATYAPIASPTFTGTVVIPTVTLSGGTINSTTIGATTPSTGAFTTLNTTGLASLNSLSTASATITGGTINGTTVGATTASTGRFTTVVATSSITPSTTAGIIGTTLADNANSGAVGELLSNSATGTSLTSNQATNLTSVSLTPGDWDVQAICIYHAASTTVALSIFSTVSTTSATLGAAGNAASLVNTFPAGPNAQQLVSPVVRVNVSSTTTVFAVGLSVFNTSTMTADGYIRARRVR